MIRRTAVASSSHPQITSPDRRARSTGAGLQRGHPLLMLRNRLLGSQRDEYSTLSGREALVAIAIKAWNAWREGRTLQTLSWRAEGHIWREQTLAADVSRRVRLACWIRLRTSRADDDARA